VKSIGKGKTKAGSFKMKKKILNYSLKPEIHKDLVFCYNERLWLRPTPTILSDFKLMWLLFKIFIIYYKN